MTWQCTSCRQWAKASAAFCPQCGTGRGTYASHSHAPPWQAQGGGDWSSWSARRPKSPRRPQSPRRKPGGGEPGRGKGKAKGHKGAAPSQGQPEQPQAPRVAALPAAPEAAGLSLPKAAPSGATAGGAASSSNTDQNLLKALLTHVAQMDNVPEELATLVGQHKDEAYRAQGKAMHKVVARQQEAQRALSKVREDRQAYELAWGQYLEQLSTLMETQLQERATTLEKFDASEDAWRKQLEEASAELSKKAAQHLSPSMDVEVQEISDQEIEEREKQVDDAIEEAKLQHSRQAREHTDAKAKDLVKAMKNLREQLPEKQRDGSRTPRRSGSKEPSGADAPTGEPGGGDKPTPPGQART